MKTRRRWTDADTATLASLANERKWSDRDIGYIMLRSYLTIRVHRRALGLKSYGKPGGINKGARASPETRARLSQVNRERWRDPAYRAKMLPHILRIGELGRAKAFRSPPRGTPEHKTYRKLIRVLGLERAHQEWQHHAAVD